jgi:hypothetical protein
VKESRLGAKERPAMTREKIFLFLAALILVCVAGLFYVEAHRYTFAHEGGAILKMDSLTGRVWVVTREKQFEIGTTRTTLEELHAAAAKGEADKKAADKAATEDRK